MCTGSQLVDRRMLSYRTALEQLGFDFDNEFNNMADELNSILSGALGIVGSPFQQSKNQPVQNAPTGTPSAGRPKGRVPKKKQPDVTQKKKTKVPKQTPSQQPGPSPKAASFDGMTTRKIIEWASNNLNDDQFDYFLSGFLSNIKN